MDRGGHPNISEFDVDTTVKNTTGVGRNLWTATEGGKGEGGGGGY